MQIARSLIKLVMLFVLAVSTMAIDKSSQVKSILFYGEYHQWRQLTVLEGIGAKL